MDGRKRTLSGIPNTRWGSIVQIEPTISDAARWQEILSTRAVAQKGNSTANKLVVSRSVYPRRVLYIFAPGWPIKHPADYTDADFRRLIRRRNVTRTKNRLRMFDDTTIFLRVPINHRDSKSISRAISRAFDHRYSFKN